MAKTLSFLCCLLVFAVVFVLTRLQVMHNTTSNNEIDDGFGVAFMLIITSVNTPWLCLFMNWMIHAERLHLQAPQPSLAVHSLDNRAFQALAYLPTTPSNSFSSIKVSPGHTHSSALNFGSASYNLLTCQRVAQIRNALLGNNYPYKMIDIVLSIDIDTVWLRDPRPFLVMPALLKTEDDSPRFSRWFLHRHVPCGGFAAFYPRHSELLLAKWQQKCDLDGGVHNDQTLLESTLALIDGSHRVKYLPTHAFPNGETYFKHFTPVQKSNAYVVHANHMKGGMDIKIQKMRENGLWRVSNDCMKRASTGPITANDTFRCLQLGVFFVS